MYTFIIVSLIAALLNAFIAKRRGYFFWRAFFFAIILCIAIGAILYKGLA